MLEKGKPESERLKESPKILEALNESKTTVQGPDNEQETTAAKKK